MRIELLHKVPTVTECPVIHCCNNTNSNTLSSRNYSILQHSTMMYYLCFSTERLWRVLNVRHICGWIQPWGSGKGFESAGWQNQTSQSLSDHSRGSLRRCCGHSSNSPSLLWNLVPMNKWMNNGELRGNISRSTHSNTLNSGEVPSPPLLYSVPSK